MKSKEYTIEVKQFIDENQCFLEHHAVQSFLKNEDNNALFVRALCFPTPENKKLVDEKFKKHYFKIRFITYLSKSIYFNAINYDKRHRRLSNRYLLTLDKPQGENGDISTNDLLEDQQSEIQENQFIVSSDIKDHITNPKLFNAINKLTIKQKEVIDLAYVKGLSDTEIGKKLDKSQQAISRLHKRALKNLRDTLNEKEGGGRSN